MNSFKELWDEVAASIRSDVSDIIYNVWIEPLKPIDFDNGIATLSATEFKRKIVEQKFSKMICDAFEKTLGFTVELKIISEDESVVPAAEKKEIPKLLKEQSTFDTFIVGSSNMFAHAAAQAVASNPGGAYNPLFIYGRSGLGKTHLLNAIEHEIKANNPTANIIYMQGEEFTNEIVKGIADKNMHEFHQKYRSADVLLVDDIQFIAGRTSTQEEFFHTFNALIQAGNQIVLSSDKPPKEIATLEERLRTRFEWGLIADIQPPDIETRMAIIKSKAQRLDLKLSDDVVRFIADKIKSNIRQLEGAVMKLKAFVTIHDVSLNLATVQAAIRDILNDNRPDDVIVDRIIDETARTYGADPKDLRSKKRDAQTSRLRMIAMHVVSEMTDLSTKAIGQEFGGRDHSTVVHALQEIKKIIERDSSVRSTIEDIIKNVQESD
ncbi:MAG: chromosomal replication initiator protein DnaA [Clostridia bacterium]|nr:chromosomal replication initiator protein DnaA [Clostridia bacterium]